jgi:hypothetical protein
MAELKRIEEEFPTAEVARDSNSPKQPEGPKLVKGQEPETLDKAAAISKPMRLTIDILEAQALNFPHEGRSGRDTTNVEHLGNLLPIKSSATRARHGLTLTRT